MAVEINAEKVLMKVSEISVTHAKTNGRVIICETSSNANISSNTNQRKTKCGIKITRDDAAVVLAGSGVAQAGISAASEVSAKDITAWMKTKKKLYYYYQNLSDTDLGIAAGDIVQLSGSGGFSDLTITSDVEDPVVTFDWEYTSEGDWSYVP